MKVVVAEKPSVAKDIARVLKADKKQDGYFAGAEYMITWALGHLVVLADPEKYAPELKKWDIRTLPVIPDRFIKHVDPHRDVAKQYSVIIKLLNASNVDEIVCATDAGREGELIFRYIYELSGSTKPVTRLWISSQTDQAIEDGFASLKPAASYDSLYDSARSRSESDWLVGINATRAYTVRFGQKDGVMSVGRVQTPVLKMIVERFNEYENFIPQIYYEIFANIKHKNGDYKGRLDIESRLFDKEKSQDLGEKIAAFPAGVVAEVSKKQKTENSPLLYDLTELQKDSNKKFKFSADKTLNIMQALYEKHKILTYPRTSSRFLSNDIKPKVHGLLQNVAVIDAYYPFVEQILAKGVKAGKRVFDDTKVTDHHAIIPTDKKPDIRQLSDDERVVYDLVVRRFLSVFMDECKKELTDITTIFGEYRFISKGTVIKKAGWRELYFKSSDSEEDDDENGQLLPQVKKDDPVTQLDVSVEERKTKAPQLYTEATILAAMETAGKQIEDEEMREAMKECGLGTPATRAQIIERLISVQYILREKNKLIPTNKGKQLIACIRNEELLSPALTGMWEKKLNDIRNDKYNRDVFMKEIKEFTQKIVSNVKFTPQVFSKKSQETSDSLGTCPLCGGSIIERGKAYGCHRWSETGCPFVLWKTVAGKTLDKEHLKQLIDKKLTEKLSGFISRAGKTFDAQLALENGKVVFKF